MKPGPGLSASLLAGRAGSCILIAGPRGPRACVRSQVGGAGSRHSWVQGLRYPEACIDLLQVCRTRVQPVPGQDLACLWVGWVLKLWDCSFLVSCVCPLVGEAGPESREGSLEGRARVQGILGLVPAHWWWSWVLRPLVGRVVSRGSCGLGVGVGV